jgi:tetratricopeptide (TPR) repeat protein
MDTESQVQNLINEAADCFFRSMEDGGPAPDEAEAKLEEALKLDYGHPVVLSMMETLHWWRENLKRVDSEAPLVERGMFIVSLWKQYYGFLERRNSVLMPERAMQAVRNWVCREALKNWIPLLTDEENRFAPEVLLQVGRSFKGAGNYAQAIRYLEQAYRFMRENGQTLSELADVNALLARPEAAKALFREAFFHDPQGVDLRFMESRLILDLADRVREAGFLGATLLAWIPVYGVLYGIFTVARKLKAAELSRLRQEIFVLENDIKARPQESALLKPELINKYFWLIDTYENAQDNAMIEVTMKKLKLLDPFIYERYTN